MSHEIRTPMNAILGMLQLLQRTELTTRQLDYAAKTQTAAQSLLVLLNDILDFSKVEAGKMLLEHTPFRIETLMRELSVIFSSSVGDKEIEVLFAIDPALPSCVFGDVTRLRQVLINLAGNAIKFTQRGTVTVSISLLSREDRHSTIAFSVQDSGIGIGPEQLTYIFEGFSQAETSTTRRFGGTGLGLAISRQLIALMGGELAVESTVSIGSRFHFNLTLEHAENSNEADSDVSSSYLRKAPQRVLIVDDNAIAREVLSSMIESLGWQVEVAASGKIALSMLQSNPHSYDVIFMDWKMPEMDGLETASKIRELQHGHPTPAIIIMVTAHGREILADRLQNEHHLLDGFLIKPVTSSMLFDAVADVSNESSPAPAKQRSMRLAGLRILVVEDTPMNQQVAQELLASEGAHVEVANDGRAGVDKVLASNLPFDAVLMDIQMPVMDGYTATSEIRRDARLQSLPVIAMTANAMDTDKEACRQAGMNDHIAKPIDLDMVVDTILWHCAKGSVGAADNANQKSTFVEVAKASQIILEVEAEFEFDVALKRLGGNKILFAKLAERFGDDVNPMIADFAEYLRQGERSKAALVMHTLKGVAGTVGAIRMAQHAGKIESRLNTPDINIDIDSTVKTFKVLTSRTRTAFQENSIDFLPTQPSPSSETIDLDMPTLSSKFDELEELLQGANMHAIAVFSELEKILGNHKTDELSSLARAINSLDFKRSLQCSLRLRESLDWTS
ncbi:MAG TPA: response regulator [Burkholderiaceae bacterium]|nr:response regulator [Burkholderiaceae bacterium]